MSVRIGHASIDENNNGRNGKSGDQNKKEVCIRSWYNKGWNVLLRPLEEYAEKMAIACEKGCANNNIGYDMSQRNTLHVEAKKVNYDLSKVDLCETDCSEFMTICAIAGGVTELEHSGNAPTTRTMRKIFESTKKFIILTDSKYLTSDKYLKRGDILLKEGSHTAMVLDNGTLTIKETSIIYPCRGIDVSTYQKNLDYQKLKDNGVQFAIIKVTNKKNQPDEGFERHYKGFAEVGVPVQFYHYSYSETVESANIAAMAVIKALNGRKGIFWLDVEDKCLQNKKERLIDIINAYQEKIEAAGLIFGIYSGLSFVKSYIVPYIDKLKCRNLWCARYYNGYNEMRIDSQLNESKKPNIPGFNLIAWQYTSSGVIEGSSGRLDCNILYEELGNNPAQKVEEVPKIKIGYVNTHSLKIRNKPDTTGKVLGYLMEGEKVLIYETDPNTGWYRIHPQTNDPHWVSNKYIDIQKS